MRARENYIDWLRVLAVLLLIYFHSARVFNHEPFYVKNATLSFPMDVFIAFVYQWHMPLFFLVSGAATFFALGFRSGRQYAGERVKRLLLPFIFGVAVIVPPQCYLILLGKPEYHDSYLTFLGNFFKINPATAGNYSGNFEWGHLWFVLYLFIFSMVALPLFLFSRGDAGQRLIARLASFSERRFALLAWALPLGVSEALLRPRWPGSNDLISDFAQLAFYITYFIYGFLLMTDPRVGRAVDRDWKAALVIVLATLPGMVYVMMVRDDMPFGYTPFWVGFLLVRGMLTWGWVVVILGLGRRFLNFKNRFLAYANQAAYPFYILHQTVIVAVAFVVVKWSSGVPLKFLAITTTSLILTVLIYDIAIKRLNPVRFLFGMHPRRAAMDLDQRVH